MIWEVKEKDLGSLKAGQTLNIEFKGDPSDGIEVKSVKASCGCTKASYDKNTHILTVKYRVKPIPYHLTHQGWYKVKKSVTVTDTKGLTTILSFQIKIIK